MLLGKSVSHVWFGDYSALYLELGQLTESKNIRKDGSRGNPIGEATVYASFDWRFERKHSILASSTSSALQRTSVAEQLLGANLYTAALIGHVPELELGFTNGIWLATFGLSKGQPDWYISFHSGEIVHLCVKRGKLAVDRRDS